LEFSFKYSSLSAPGSAMSSSFDFFSALSSAAAILILSKALFAFLTAYLL